MPQVHNKPDQVLKMASGWLVALGCLCAVVTVVHAGVMPDSLIVTKPDDVGDVSTLATTTTEEPLPAIKLMKMDVDSEIMWRYSRTSVTSLVKNPAKRSQECNFKVLLPETAFISGFIMTIDGEDYKAYVKEKEEAKQIYDNAVSAGLGAAHIATKARDSNQISVSVNVKANSTVLFNLTYEEMLSLHNGLYNHVINLHPGSKVQNLTVKVHIKESQNITTLRVPEVVSGNEIIPTEEDAQNQIAEVTRSSDGREATVVFKPDLNEQTRLMEIYAQKSKESLGRAFNLGDDDMPSEGGSLGQFVVQYNVNRSIGNEILINDGWFVHFLAPSNLTALNKFVVFVLDLSGSMYGRKIEQLKESMTTILNDLKESDSFCLVTFESDVQIHDLKEHGSRCTPPYPATPENIAKAKAIVSEMRATGGTNIADALDVAVDVIHRGLNWNQTTNQVKESNNKTIENKQIQKYEFDDKKNLEPLIIFLTDGEPTVGETDPERIIRRVAEKNYGPEKAPIFSIALGDYADGKFLRKLSLQNYGFNRHVYEAADSSLQMQDFYKQISSPLLANVKFSYLPGQVKEDSLTKVNFRTFYALSEIVVAGKLEPSVTDISSQVYGDRGFDEGFGRKRFEFHPTVIQIKEKKGNFSLERLWAYLTIKQLLEERDAADNEKKPVEGKTDPEKKALKLALEYSFVTPLTSLVVVKPNETSAVNAESVDKSLSSGVSAFAPASPAFAPQGVSLSAPAYGFAAPASIGLFGAGYPGLPGGPGAPAPPRAPSYPRPVSGSAAANAFGFGGGYGGYGPGSAFGPITTPAEVPALFVYTTEEPDALPMYGLEQFSWTKSLLNPSTDELVMKVNGTDIHLKLTKDNDILQKLGDEACSNATDGAAGSCVYLTRCEAARNITVDLYSMTYCQLNKYAGVCCPLSSISNIQSAVIQG